MKQVFVLINHTLTERQNLELKRLYGSDCQLIFPPEEIKAYWAQIPPKPFIESNKIQEIVTWLGKANNNDVLLVQGDFGATFLIVDYALKNGLVPIQSVTKRIETEEYYGEKVYKHYVFEHECFREYKSFSDTQEYQIV